MNIGKFAQQLEALQARVVALEQRAGNSSQQDHEVLEAAFNELRNALEELRVSEEELRHQHLELLTTWRKLEVAYQRYQDLFNFAPDAYLVTNMNGTIQEANRTAAQLLGMSQASLEGKSLLLFVVASARQPFRSDLRRLRRTGGTHVWEVRLQPYRLPPIDAAVTMASIRDQTGQLGTLRWMLRDITAHKRAEETRLILERKLLETQKLESLGVLAGGMAHDFNNLLATIIGNAELALLDLPLDPLAARVCIEQVLLASQHAAGLAQQLVAYAGKGRFVVEPIDLNAFIAEMATLLHASIPKNVTLQPRLAALQLPIMADANQMRQIVMNLIANAGEAIGTTTGTITLTTGLQHADRAYLTTTSFGPDLPEGTYVTLEVGDTGIGMDSATCSKIFEPFFTTKFTGRGLGLSAVLGIVRSHGGTLRVESAPSHGSTFTILFPHVTVADEQESHGPESHTLRPTSGLVLVIDDEESVRAVMARMLGQFGFTVLTAMDGQSGLELFRSHAEELVCVLLNLTMPTISGEEAFQAIRRIKPDARIVLMSGHNEQELISHFGGTHPQVFLQKPFTLRALREQLDHLFGICP